jgi:hypothetical protein
MAHPERSRRVGVPRLKSSRVGLSAVLLAPPAYGPGGLRGAAAIPHAEYAAYFRTNRITMRSKKLKHVKTSKWATRNRICIYCGAHGSTRDHVPPRLLLEKPYPSNLHSVPACPQCNNNFSEDEEYFLELLAHIGTVGTLAAKIEVGGSVDRAFTKTPVKEDRLIASLVTEDNRVVIMPEVHRVERVIRKIAQGLYFIRYGKRVGQQDIQNVAAYPYNIEDHRPTLVFINLLSQRFPSKQWKHVQPQVFSFIFTRAPLDQRRVICTMNFHSTLWGVASMPIAVRSNKRNSRLLTGQLSLEI